MAERPQHMLMRVAIGIHERDIEGAIEVSNEVLTHMLLVTNLAKPK